MDKTTFWWAGLCGICHPGGGPTEFDRDGELLYDAATGLFGYEKLGRNDNDVVLDGDYSEINTSNGSLRKAPWDVTGVAEADCLMCHRTDLTVADGMTMNWVWRAATMRAKDKLVDSADASVPAFAAAPTAGQGWWSFLEMAAVPPGKPPMLTKLDVDYQKGLNAGVLRAEGGDLYLEEAAITGTPKDRACWGCHAKADMKKRGRMWFDAGSDVHYAAFNRLNDGDAANDIGANDSKACAECHPAGMKGMAFNHNIAKGNAILGSARNDTDYTDFRTCADCHLASSPLKHADAPAPPTTTYHNTTHRSVMSCESCHIPYKSLPADLVVDNALKGATVAYKTNAFLSANPLDPSDPDKSRWYPALVWKKDRDGATRIFPAKRLLSMWWGDWDRNGTPGFLGDDKIKPIPLWRVRQITLGQPLPAVTDGTVNSEAEIAAYIAALKGNDSHGNPVALNPVLVKGGKVWYEDDGVHEFEYEGTGIKTESSHPFAINHNVLPTSQAWGAVKGCADCHGSNQTPVFDRLILVDPFGPKGQPIYMTVRELLGLDPW